MRLEWTVRGPSEWMRIPDLGRPLGASDWLVLFKGLQCCSGHWSEHGEVSKCISLALYIALQIGIVLSK